MRDRLKSAGSRRTGRRNAAAAAAFGFGLLAAGAALAHQAPVAPSSMPAAAATADFSGEPASSDARRVADWVMGTGDNRRLPFVIVDKKAAKVFVFDGQGHILGHTSALLGLARGDDSAPGVGDRDLADIRPEERTTPAGRFVASLGHDLGPDDVLWVDYRAALALHRVLAANSREHRLERLASAAPGDHRITFGCINVPVNFYDAVIDPAFTGTSGIVYILPEVKSISEVFFRSAS
jgi:hypothetical protein